HREGRRARRRAEPLPRSQGGEGVRQRTHDILLWLAGIGGAIVIAGALVGLLTTLAVGLYAMTGLVLLVLLIAAALVALFLARARLDADPVPFSETRP